MKKLLCGWWLLLLPAFTGQVLMAAETFDEGFEYHRVIPPQPISTGERIEVLEMFWYGCPHCYRFEPKLVAWKKSLPPNVRFVRLPTVFRPSWEIHARAYYTAKVLGVLDRIHQPLFDAIHKQGRRLGDRASLQTFFTEHGVSAADFDKAFDSFVVQSRLKRAIKMSNRYGATGVPSMVINGKYRTDARSASLNDPGGPSHDNMLKVVDYLIEKESKLLASSHTETRQ